MSQPFVPMSREAFATAVRGEIVAMDERAESRNSAHALVAKAVVQLDAVLTTLSSANHAASPEGRLITTDLIRMAGALRSRAIELEDAMAKMGKRT